MADIVSRWCVSAVAALVAGTAAAQQGMTTGPAKAERRRGPWATGSFRARPGGAALESLGADPVADIDGADQIAGVEGADPLAGVALPGAEDVGVADALPLVDDAGAGAMTSVEGPAPALGPESAEPGAATPFRRVGGDVEPHFERPAGG